MVGPREDGAASASVALGRQGDLDIVCTFRVSKIVEILVSWLSVLLNLANELPIPTFTCLCYPWLVLQIIIDFSNVIVEHLLNITLGFFLDK